MRNRRFVQVVTWVVVIAMILGLAATAVSIFG
jgi:hypothetical protein